jgi:hypothetical protein
MAEVILGQAKFTVKIVPLVSNCPKFEKVKLLPYQVQSAVSSEAFQVFVSALGGTDQLSRRRIRTTCFYFARNLALRASSLKLRPSFPST